ncbi:MAG TPA: nitrilase-related carbon-nitrogen hydrolase [Candidatus Sulfomarinibacteraceae bacterium]|nr:nitrilase-related carbon-nitrogen hydrolase [Candidatus Sulfomarinibacteraceae bacterium]
MKVNVGLAQINPRLGDVSANLALHLRTIEEAAAQGVELLVFPELSLTGYRLRDLAFEVAIKPTEKDPTFARLLQASRDMDVVVGFVEADKRQKFYISAAYLSGGELLHVHRKVYLPTYGMFDEGRYFAWGDTVRAFDTRFGRIGLLICEDFWHVSAAYLLWLDGADILILTSSSPGRGLATEQKIGSARWVEHINQAYASIFTNFVIHANRTGFEDGVNYWGGSTVYDPEGVLQIQGPYYEDTLVTARLDLNKLRRARIRLPLLRDERVELTRRELQRILDA